MKKVALIAVVAVMALSGTSLFAGPRVSIGIGIGVAPAPMVTYVAPPPPPVAYVAPVPAPPVAYVAPARGFVWVAGYYNLVGPRYVWVPGRWVRPPFAGAVRVAPHHFRGRFYTGYWRR